MRDAEERGGRSGKEDKGVLMKWMSGRQAMREREALGTDN